MGALIVKDSTIISDGYNGTPTGHDNCCEIDNWAVDDYFENGESFEVTKWEVIHAEVNAILKCAKNGISCDGGTIYVTLSPCRDCSKLIVQSGIKRLVYKEVYRDGAGLKFLEDAGVAVNKLPQSFSK